MRGPNVFAGYWRNAEATRAAFTADGWLRTGDIAEADDEGNYRIKGRLKDMVISGGENVYPAEIESVLHEHPAVADAAVVGVPDDEWGERIHAVVVPKPGRGLDAAALDAFVAERLAGFKRPRSWEVRHALPRTESGKLLKRVLRAEYRDGQPSHV